MIIDEQGRLFGRLNVVDAAVVLAVVVGIVMVVTRISGPVKLVAPVSKPVTVNLCSEPLPPNVTSDISKGEQLFLSVGADTVPLGTIADIKTRVAEVRLEDPKTGKITYAKDPRQIQLLLTLKGTGTLTKQIVTISGNAVLIGQTLQAKTQKTMFNAGVIALKFGG